MKQVRILITSAGGLVIPGMIKNLRASFKNIYIVGVDMDTEAVGFYLADKGHVICSGTDQKFPEQILKVAQEERVGLVLPLSDEEMLALSEKRDIFAREGIKVICSDHEIIKIAQDKALMLEYLKKKGVPCPEFRVPTNLQELERAIGELGYPEKCVVFKPRNSRGARGFWLLDANLNKADFILKSRDRQEITLEWLLDALKNEKEFPKVIVMEYLPGEDFNVDVLAWKGEPLFIIPNQRLLPKAGPVRVGLVKHDEKVRKYVEEVVKAFGFDYFVNVEVAYRSGEDERPLVYEINPRVSGPIVINKQAGVDALKLGLDLALGEKIPKNEKFEAVKMIRYWNELFIKSESNQ